MIHAQNTVKYNLIAPQSVGTTEVTGLIDLANGDYAAIDVNLAAAATSVSVSTLTISEGDSSTSFTAIPEMTGGTASANFTLPTADGTDSTGQIVRFEIDARKRKRYLKIALANSAGRVSVATGELTRQHEVQTAAADRNLTTLVRD